MSQKEDVPASLQNSMFRRKVLKTTAILGACALGVTSGCTTQNGADSSETLTDQNSTNQLPLPAMVNTMSVPEALANRRSRRSYTEELLTIEELGQLLWAAQGATSPYGLRTAPSAGGLYPIEMYAVVGEECVEGLSAGIYRYVPGEHRLDAGKPGDIREELCQASVHQVYVQEAPVDIVFTAVYRRTTDKYGDRGIRYIHMEAGHAAQNMYLQAEAMGLGMVVIGAFDDSRVRELIGAGIEETPLYVIPAGKKKI